MHEMIKDDYEDLTVLQRQLDRLADGELDDSEQRKLLLWLEEHPGQWRGCALAMIEIQKFGQDFKQVRRDLEAPRQPLVEPVRRRHEPKKFHSWMGVAAAVLLSFTTGIAIQTAMSDRSSVGPDLGGQLAGMPQSSPPSALDSRELYSHASAPIPPESSWINSDSEMGPENEDLVTLAVDNGQSIPRTVQVPLVDAEQVGVKLPSNTSALPEHMVRRLEQLGHRVERQRRVAPVQLEDGRQMWVPVEDIKVVPVSRPVY